MSNLQSLTRMAPKALSAWTRSVALSGLIEMPGGQKVNSDDVADIMRQYDTDGNGVLDADEFKIFVRDLVLNGVNGGKTQFVFKEDLQQAVDQIAMAAKEDPWADVLRGDSGVRSMIDREIRKDRQLSSRSRDGDDSDSFMSGGSDSFVRWGSRASQRGRKMSKDVLALGSSKRSRSPTAPPSKCSRFGETCWSIVCCCCICMPVLHPDGRLRSLWNVAMALFIIYCGVVVPLEIAFEVSMKAGMGPQGYRMFEWWNLVVDMLFIIDIILNFRTGFLVEGQLVKDAPRIARHYFFGAFFIDLIGSFPLNFVLLAINSDDSREESAGRLNRQLRLLRIVKLNRLLRLAKLSKNLKYIELFIKFNPSMMRVVKMFLLMFGCCHWMGCAWWFVADMELINQPGVPFNAWQPSAYLMDPTMTLGPQFARAFFWGAGMVTGFVPYDIEPDTEIESWFTAICMFVGLVLNAFVIGSMASALSTMDSKKALAAGKLRTIEAYLQLNSVTPELRSHILEFYEYLYTSTQSFEDLKLYQELPPSLATKLAITVHKRVVSRAPFFVALSDDAVLAVLARLKAVIYVPSQVILVEGSPLKAIYFVKKGKVALVSNLGNKELEAVQKSFGQYDNFGFHIEANGKQLSDTEVAQQLLNVQLLKEGVIDRRPIAMSSRYQRRISRMCSRRSGYGRSSRRSNGIRRGREPRRLQERHSRARKRSGDGIITLREPATWKEVELRLLALASSRRIAGRLTGGGAFSAGEDVAVV